MSEHATISVDGYTIPLIGIPKEATLGECDCCHEVVGIQSLELSDGGQMLCKRCRKGGAQ